MKALKTENQNTAVTIGKDFCVYVHRPQGSISFQAGHAAMKDLSIEGFVLYISLLMRPQNQLLTFCDKSLQVQTKLTKGKLTKAKQELLEKGYLTPSRDKRLSEEIRAITYNLRETPLERTRKIA